MAELCAFISSIRHCVCTPHSRKGQQAPAAEALCKAILERRILDLNLVCQAQAAEADSYSSLMLPETAARQLQL